MSFEVTGSGQSNVTRISSGNLQEGVSGIGEFVVVKMSANGLLLMVLVALPLDAVTSVMVGVEDIASVVDWLVDFLIGIIGVGQLESSVCGSLLAMLVSTSLLARVDGVVAS